MLCSFVLYGSAVLWHWTGLESGPKDESTKGDICFPILTEEPRRSWCGNGVWIVCYSAIEGSASSLTLGFFFTIFFFYPRTAWYCIPLIFQSILTRLPVPAAEMYSHSYKLHTLCGRCDRISVQGLICPNVKCPSVIRGAALMPSEGETEFCELSLYFLTNACFWTSRKLIQAWMSGGSAWHADQETC